MGAVEIRPMTQFVSSPIETSFIANYDFGADTLEVIVGGRSSLDALEGFSVDSAEDALSFLKSYGFDPDNPIENAELLGNYHESLNFIRRYFLVGEHGETLLEVPRVILELTRVTDLFLMINAGREAAGAAANSSARTLGLWACSVLKVMHTISHIDRDLRAPHFSDIQKSIFDRFYRLIQRDAGGKLYLGESARDPRRVPLCHFETKPKKTRDSTILKLLHKPENVAEDIFDRVGLRFVTSTRLQALQVIHYLKEKRVVMPPHIKPSRSRNTLMDIPYFTAALERALDNARQGRLSEDQLRQRLEEAANRPPPPSELTNQHTQPNYQAIQFTCRQLVKLTNPLYENLWQLKHQAKNQGGDPAWVQLVDAIDLKNVQREIRFFYPYEVQIMDQLSATGNEQGRSAHEKYKLAQIRSAQKRVMGRLLEV